MVDLSGRLHFRVIKELGPTFYEREGMSDAELRLRVLEMLEWAIDHEESAPLTGTDRRALVAKVASDILDHAGAVHREPSVDPMAELRRRLHFRVVEKLGPTLYDRRISDAEFRLRVLEALEWTIDHEQPLPLTGADRRALVNEVASDILDHAGGDPITARRKNELGRAGLPRAVATGEAAVRQSRSIAQSSTTYHTSRP